MLINSQVHRTKRASTDFLLDDILIDTMHGSPIVFAICVFRASMQRLFHLARLRVVSVTVSQWTPISWTRSGFNCTSVNFVDMPKYKTDEYEKVLHVSEHEWMTAVLRSRNIDRDSM